MLGIFHHWWLPVLSAIIWWGMLIALLSVWAGEGFPSYTWMDKPDQHILYISNIAAGRYQPIFISCSAAQGLLFVLSLASEMYLRNNGRLRPNHQTYGRWCLGGALAFAILGQLGILFVSIFNTRDFHDAHISLLVLFIVFVGISSLFSVAEYWALDRDYTHKRHMIVGLWLKVAWFIVEFFLAIVFVSSQRHHVNVPAVFEWLISFVYPFYQLILAWDLWPAINKKKGHYPRYNDHYPQDPEATIMSESHELWTYDAPSYGPTSFTPAEGSSTAGPAIGRTASPHSGLPPYGSSEDDYDFEDTKVGASYRSPFGVE